jgi:hypothetical protein
MLKDLINEFGYFTSMVVSVLIGFATLWWTLEILTFLQDNWDHF